MKISQAKFWKYSSVTIFTIAVLALFLSPLVYMVFTSLKTPEQMTMEGAPIYPARQATFEYKGKTYDIFKVPFPEGERRLAMIEKGRSESSFIDPGNPDGALIKWQGSWRTLQRDWSFSPTWSNFSEVWDSIDFLVLFRNTLAIALISEVGTLLSCILVAYGFSRFRFPGRDFFFTLLMSTIFLPAAVTLVPTYAFFAKIGWIGTWLPLLVPVFFANAYDVFLLRQYFLTIPREMDEAAMIDGAGPLRTLVSIILPQSIPVIISVSVFHLVWAWNDFFGPLIYLSTKPELQPIAVGIQRFNGVHATRPPMVQAASLLALIVPVLIFIFAQKAFMRGVVVTGVEK
jgi:multiple sugar transport system permease protein